MKVPRILIVLSLCLGLALWGKAQSAEGGSSLPDSIRIALALHSPDSSQVNYLLAQAKSASTYDLDLSLQCAQAAYEIAADVDDIGVRTNALQVLGTCQLQKGNNAAAILIYEEGLEELPEWYREAEPKKAMRMYNNLGGGYFSLGNFDLALERFRTTLEYAERANDQRSVGLCYHNISRCFSSMEKHDMAEEFLLKSLDIKLELGDSAYLVSSYVALAELEMFVKGNAEAAFAHLETGMALSIALQNYRQQSQVLYQRATLYLGQEKWASALADLVRTDKMAIDMGDVSLRITVNSVMGECLYHLGKLDQAAEKLGLAASLAEDTENLEQENFAHYWLSEVLAAQGDSGQALHYFKMYEEEKDSLRTLAIQEKAATAEAQYKVQSYQEASEKARTAKENAVFVRNLSVGAGLLVLLLGLTLLWRERKLRSKQKELNRFELDAFTSRLKEKNALIATLEEQVSGNAAEAVSGGLSFAELLQMKILTDEDWREFQILFAKVYPGYIMRIRRAHPQLTAGEHRLFLLLKLQLTSREIADMLGISAQGVKVARHRLRKKIGLDTAQSLEEFISEA